MLLRLVVLLSEFASSCSLRQRLPAGSPGQRCAAASDPASRQGPGQPSGAARLPPGAGPKQRTAGLSGGAGGRRQRAEPRRRLHLGAAEIRPGPV